MLRLTKKTFIGLLTALVNVSNYTKSVSLSNQKFMIQPPTLIYILQNTVNNFTTNQLQSNKLSNKLCITNKAVELNLSS